LGVNVRDASRELIENSEGFIGGRAQVDVRTCQELFNEIRGACCSDIVIDVDDMVRAHCTKGREFIAKL